MLQFPELLVQSLEGIESGVHDFVGVFRAFAFESADFSANGLAFVLVDSEVGADVFDALFEVADVFLDVWLGAESGFGGVGSERSVFAGFHYRGSNCTGVLWDLGMDNMEIH